MKMNLYAAGNDGYFGYRIPALLLTGKGTLLAFCEGRRNGLGDEGDIDIVLKRSGDGGATWSAMQVVYGEPGGVTIGNPCPVETADGRILLPFCRNNDRVFVTESADDGLTWSAPVEITTQAKADGWTWYATGPGIGVRKEREPHKGRIIIPSDHQAPAAYGFGSHALISDDEGATWHFGASLGKGSNECQVVELADGSLMMNTRMQREGRHLRGVSRSTDGGETWSEIVHDENLPCPICQAGFIKAEIDGESVLLFSNPAVTDSRTHMTIRVSRDEGATWASKELHAGPTAYSSIAALPGGEICCLYEAGENHRHEHIVFDTLTLAEIEG